jgi:hypothetical protein
MRGLVTWDDPHHVAQFMEEIVQRWRIGKQRGIEDDRTSGDKN